MAVFCLSARIFAVFSILFRVPVSCKEIFTEPAEILQKLDAAAVISILSFYIIKMKKQRTKEGQFMNKYDWRYLLRQLSRGLTSWSRWDSTICCGERHRRRHGLV